MSDSPTDPKIASGESMPNIEDMNELRREIERREKTSKKRHIPFNRAALLRRIAQSKGRFYDSAEYVLKNGWPGSVPKRTAYFQPAPDTVAKPTKTTTSTRSRFQGTYVPDEESASDEESAE
eukprot:gnl/Dysnectes_brevis/201_a230_9352.p1 GENE.gnl/Dysnectes_brevis/201_a230_9352~~gnl/Dysnectes_brevis/201_a230_9352.p1  ORF type:complete len:122 (-),score=9.76 gnl/Dysnectes_brevis/201_a230_9352:66-431(-)